jgi:hypothetical protein
MDPTMTLRDSDEIRAELQDHKIMADDQFKVILRADAKRKLSPAQIALRFDDALEHPEPLAKPQAGARVAEASISSRITTWSWVSEDGHPVGLAMRRYAQ